MTIINFKSANYEFITELERILLNKRRRSLMEHPIPTAAAAVTVANSTIRWFIHGDGHVIEQQQFIPTLHNEKHFQLSGFNNNIIHYVNHNDSFTSSARCVFTSRHRLPSPNNNNNSTRRPQRQSKTTMILSNHTNDDNNEHEHNNDD